MRHPARIVPLAALLALLLAIAVAAPALAQKPPPPPPPSSVLPPAVSFDIQLAIRVPGDPEEAALRATGRANLGDDLALELRLAFPSDPSGDSLDLVLVGDRVYVREDSGPWEYVSLADFLEDSAGPGQAADRCGDDLPDFARFADPEALLRQIGGGIGPPSFEQLRGIPVVHYRGELELQRLVEFFAGSLAMDPDCADVIGDLMDDELDETFEDLPPLQFDIYLGVNDQFPYRIALSLDLTFAAFLVTIDLTPSPTPFAIQPPAGARPATPPVR